MYYKLRQALFYYKLMQVLLLGQLLQIMQPLLQNRSAVAKFITNLGWHYKLR